MAAQIEHIELFSKCTLEGHLPKWEGRGGVDGCGIKVAVCERCGEELATYAHDFTKESRTKEILTRESCQPPPL